MRATVAALAAILLAGCFGGGGDGGPDASPYAEWKGEPLRALPPDQVASLREGDGMGYALAAELNGYPGPRHILELADELALDANQRWQVQDLHNRTSEAARTIGAQLLDAYAQLDGLFRAGAANPSLVSDASRNAAILEGQLRTVHLVAHVQARDILSPHQNQLYQELRGYAEDGHAHDGQGD